MIRHMVKIDEEKCNGCGLCISSCHEGAIALIDGKARLIRDDYCDGLGNCLGKCPQDAITLEEREAAPFDEAAVKERMEAARSSAPSGCPGCSARAVEPEARNGKNPPDQESPISELRNWPLQLALVPVNASYLQGAKLVVAADCTGFAHTDFHRTFLKEEGKICLIGCPKLDEANVYAAKLAQIITLNEITEIHAVRMHVPCCGGLVRLIREAIERSGRRIPLRVTTINASGKELSSVVE